MEKGCFIPSLFLVLIVLVFVGCVKNSSDESYDQLFLGLEKEGLIVEEVKTEDVGDSILSGKQKSLKINEDEFIYAYIYENTDKMNKDISHLSQDGFGYDDGNKQIVIDWMYQPHFYKKENMVVLYIGRNEKILDTLENIMNRPFIGAEE